MSNIENREVVTCPSCEYRYPGDLEACVMCGAATRIPEKALVPNVPHAPQEAAPQVYGGNLQGQSPPARSRRVLTLWSVAVVTAVLALIAGGHYIGQNNLAEGRPPATLATTVPVAEGTEQAPRQPSVVHRHNRRTPTTGMQPVVKARVTTRIEPAEPNDPAGLWKAVRHGNTPAEVTLAKLYLQGETVSRNCEQARVLLIGASRKGSKAADAVLSGAYAEQCQ